MEKIDLHLHSNYSDGTFTPEEIVLEARRRNMSLIALTDHNLLSGIPDFRAACHKYGQKAQAGIELSTDHHGTEIHVLGWFDLEADTEGSDFEELRQHIADYHTSKVRQNEQMVQKMSDAGYPLSVDGFNRFARTINAAGNFNRVHIAKYMISLGLVSSINEAMDKYIGKTGPYYVKRDMIPVEEAIRLIHCAGGLAAIAHVGEYHYKGTAEMDFLHFCLARGADGFELLHPHNTTADSAAILRVYHEHLKESGQSLILSAGSDFHGRNKPNEIGLPWKDYDTADNVKK